MRIAEIYASLQGEGLLAGTPSTFVRTSGCNLRCRWCDTPFTSWEPVGEERSVAEIAAAVQHLGRSHVVITGGEPLLFVETIDLGEWLRRHGHHVTIETAGTVLPEGVGRRTFVDLMSISPKLASSAPATNTASGWAGRHEASRRRDDVLADLMGRGSWQMKFVIDSPADLAETVAWLRDLGVEGDQSATPVFLMPQGVSEADLARTTAWLADECGRLGFRLAPRHHIAWYGNARAT